MLRPQNKRRTPEEWKELVQQQAASGQSIPEFARAHGVSTTSLREWKGKLSTEAQPAFTQIKIQQPNRTQILKCKLANGLELEWETNNPESSVLMIMEALK